MRNLTLTTETRLSLNVPDGEDVVAMCMDDAGLTSFFATSDLSVLCYGSDTNKARSISYYICMQG
jgi:hypothetical protein